MGEAKKCPVCNEEYASVRKLKNHIAKIVKENIDNKFLQHRALLMCYDKYKLRCDDIIPFYDKYQIFFIQDVNTAEDILSNIQTKLSKEKTFKKSSNNQYVLQNLQQQLLNIEEKKALTTLQKNLFSELEEKDKPLALLHYFYDKSNCRSYNQLIELKKIKDLYIKNGLDANQIRLVMDYMIAIGMHDLLKINYYINDGLLFKQYMQESKIENTSAYFVRMYYIRLAQKCIKSNFVKEVKLIETARITNNLSNQQVGNIINGMVKNKKLLVWFNNHINQYINDNSVSYSIVHEYSESREVNNTVSEIMKGALSFEQVSCRLKKSCFELLKQKFIKGDFDSRYNHLEFAYKIRMNLTKELYDFAINHSSNRPSRFAVLKTTIKEQDKLEKLKQQFQSFKKWLNSQPMSE